MSKTRTLISGSLVVASILLASVPLQAQNGETTHIVPQAQAVANDYDGTVKGSLARRIADGYAICVVGRHYKPTLKALQTPPSTAARAKALSDLVDRDCLRNGELSFSNNGMQASLFRALVVRDWRTKDIAFAKVPLDFEKIEMTATGSPWPTKVASVLNLAGCVVRANPKASRDVILSDAGTKSEKTAMNALMPELGKCVRAAERLSFSRDYFSGALAEAFYREAEAGKAAGGQ